MIYIITLTLWNWNQDSRWWIICQGHSPSKEKGQGQAQAWWTSKPIPILCTLAFHWFLRLSTDFLFTFFPHDSSMFYLNQLCSALVGYKDGFLPRSWPWRNSQPCYHCSRGRRSSVQCLTIWESTDCLDSCPAPMLITMLTWIIVSKFPHQKRNAYLIGFSGD